MDVLTAVEIIRFKLNQVGGKAKIPKLREGTFTAELVDGGVRVDNLANQPFLPWAAFQEAICVLIRNGGHADRGEAMSAKLGEPGLSTDSIEGHVAQIVYGKQLGDSVFRRIVPIACILIWADLCEARPRELLLKSPKDL